MNDNDNKYNVAVVYTDQGPSGPCGQSVITTSAWTKVFLFENEEKAYEWLKTYKFPNRKRYRITMCDTTDNFVSTLEYPTV